MQENVGGGATLKDDLDLDRGYACRSCGDVYDKANQPVAFHDMDWCETCLRKYYDMNYRAHRKVMGFQIFAFLHVLLFFVAFVRQTNGTFQLAVKWQVSMFFAGLVGMVVIAAFGYGFYRLMTFRLNFLTGLLVALPALGIVGAPIPILMEGHWWELIGWALIVGGWIFFLVDANVRNAIKDPFLNKIQFALLKNAWQEKMGVSRA